MIVLPAEDALEGVRPKLQRAPLLARTTIAIVVHLGDAGCRVRQHRGYVLPGDAELS
jgi:hypothetical protein